MPAGQLFDSPDPVLAASAWPTNAELIEDCARLGYIGQDVLDATYGYGTWWNRVRPEALVCNDLDPTKGDVHHDFGALPDEWADRFDTAAFDPPYVSVGGRATSGIPDLHERFGLTDAPTSPAGVQAQIDMGLMEMFRVVKPGGFVLVKCQDYVSSGKLWLGTHWTLTMALQFGFECVDRFEHVGRPRPQPPRRQVHARRNLSTLFVLQRPARKETAV